jgi:hypothetical protein
MSDTRGGLISALVAPFADEAAAQARRPPHAQRQSRAGYGAFFLTWCYTTAGINPFAPDPLPPAFQYAWWGCAALGAYWLLAGLFGRARGPLTGGLGLLAEAAGASWLLWSQMYPAGSTLAALLLHGVYLSVLCSALAQFAAAFLAMPRGDAESVVRENMAMNNPPIIPVRRTR